MNAALPETLQSFSQIFLNALRYYFPVLKKTLLLIVLFTLVMNAYLYFRSLSSNQVFHYIVLIVMLLILVYLWAVFLQLANACLQQQLLSLKTAFRDCFIRVLPIYLTVVCYALGVAVIIILANLIVWLAMKMWGHAPKMLTLIHAFLVGIPVLYGLVLTYFAFPLVVIKKYGVLSAFREAALITGKEWFEVFGVYVVTVIILFFIWPHTEIVEWMWHHHLTILYDFIVFLILLPIQANLIILVLHNLQLRWRQGAE